MSSFRIKCFQHVILSYSHLRWPERNIPAVNIGQEKRSFYSHSSEDNKIFRNCYILLNKLTHTQTLTHTHEATPKKNEKKTNPFQIIDHGYPDFPVYPGSNIHMNTVSSFRMFLMCFILQMFMSMLLLLNILVLEFRNNVVFCFYFVIVFWGVVAWYPVAPVYLVISLNSNILGTEPLFLPVM